MVAQDGVGLILKYNTTGVTFVAPGGQRNTTVTLTHEPVDVTSKDDESTSNNTLYRKYANGMGIQYCSVATSGVFTDDTALSSIRNLFQNRTAGNFKVIIPGSNLNNIEGSFKITSLAKSADYNDAVMYDLTIESAGDISYTT